LADLAGKQALARLNASVAAQQATPATDASDADAAPEDAVDPATAVDEVVNGIDDLVASTDQQVDGAAGDAAATIGEILQVPLPRPRERLGLASSTTYLKCRQRVLEFLHERHRMAA